MIFDFYFDSNDDNCEEEWFWRESRPQLWGHNLQETAQKEGPERNKGRELWEGK